MEIIIRSGKGAEVRHSKLMPNWDFCVCEKTKTIHKLHQMNKFVRSLSCDFKHEEVNRGCLSAGSGAGGDQLERHSEFVEENLPWSR